MAVIASFGTTGDLNLAAGIQLDADNDWTNLNYFSQPVTVADPGFDTEVVNLGFMQRLVQDPTSAGLPYNSCVLKAGTQTLTGDNTFDVSPNCRDPVNTVDALNLRTLNANLAQFAGVTLNDDNTFTGVNTFTGATTTTTLGGTKASVTTMANVDLTAAGSFTSAATTVNGASSTSAVYFVKEGTYPKQLVLGVASSPGPGTSYNPNGRFVYLERNNTGSLWPISLNKAVDRPYYQTWLVTGTATTQGSIIFPTPESLSTDPVGQIVQIWNGLLAGKTLLITGETTAVKFYTKPSTTNTWTSNTTYNLVSGFCITLVYGGNNIWYSMFDD